MKFPSYQHQHPDGVWRNYTLPVVCSVVFAALLAFWGLGNNDFWDDEAFTAVYSRNLMESGRLIAWDGRNLVSYGMRAGVDEDMVNRNSPLLQFVVAGLSMKIFGDSEFGGRSLFVLIGLLSIPLFAAWFRYEFDSDHYWIVVLILASSVPYLLYMRQLRYYPLVLTFSAGLLWAWARLSQAERPYRWVFVGTLFLCLLVLSHYLGAVGAVTVIVTSMIRKKYRNRENLAFIGVILGLGLVGASLLFLHSPFALEKISELGTVENLRKLARLMWMVPRDATRFEFFPVGMLFFALLGAAIVGKGAKAHVRNIGLTLVYALSVVMVVSFFSIHTPTSAKINADMRYYLILIPLGAAVAAHVYRLLADTRIRGLPQLFLLILVLSNFLTLNFFGPIGLHSRLAQYVHEVSADYTTGTEAISQYIGENISEDKCIFLVPMVMNIVQMYYQPQHKFCGLVTRETPLAKKQGETLRTDLFWENTIPDYFIVGGKPPDQFLLEFLELNYGEGTFELEAVLPVYWANATRPEIPLRSFTSISISDPFLHGVLIFRRTDQPAHPPRIGALEAEPYLLF